LSRVSLRHGLTLRVGVWMLVLSVLVSMASYRLALMFGDEAYDEWLLDSARTLAQFVKVQDGAVRFDPSSRTLSALVFDAHDRVLFRISDDREGWVAGQAHLADQAFQGQGLVRYQNLVVDGQAMRAVELTAAEVNPGSLVRIVVAETLNKRNRLASRMLGTVMLVSGLLTLLTLLALRDAIRRGLRPLQLWTDAVRSRRAGDLTPLPAAQVAEELDAFTDAINGLLARLQLAMQSQQRFIGDAAHQLRTPLTALQLELTHALRETEPLRHQQALTQVKLAIDRMARLTHQLLTLARAEPGALADGHFDRLDWRKLAHGVCMRQIDGLLRSDLDLAFEGDEPVWVRGDALLLEEQVHNLLDNARRYAGAGAQVLVKVSHETGGPCLCVEDNGPGVPEAELPRLTTRFHRPAGSPPGGSGLGLAIVDEISRLHRGQLTAEAVAPHGLRLRITLPAAEVPAAAPAQG